VTQTASDTEDGSTPPWLENTSISISTTIAAFYFNLNVYPEGLGVHWDDEPDGSQEGWGRGEPGASAIGVPPTAAPTPPEPTPPSELSIILANTGNFLLNYGKIGLQLGADALNGAQDAVVGLVNLGIGATPNDVLGLPPVDLTISSPDWSNGLFYQEPGAVHAIAKLVLGQAIVMVATDGLSGAGDLAEGADAAIDAASESAGTAADAAGPSDAAADAAQEEGRGNPNNPDDDGCFLAGTEVLLGNGTEAQIQDITVGEHVATDGGVANSPTGTAAADSDSTDVDPATWRELTITSGDWQVQILEPLTWIQSHELSVGSLVDLDEFVNLLDIGVPTDIVGTIQSIGACPTIASGPGRVVLATVTHLNDDVFNLTMTDNAGDSTTIGVTGYHKIYTEDRGWVDAGDLYDGELVRGDNGDVTVTGLSSDPGTYRVYNLDVEDDHVYYVSDLDALVHNVWCDGQHHVDPEYLGGDPDGPTVKLPGQIHQLVHQILDERLIDEFGESVRSFGRVAKYWDHFFEDAIDSSLRERALEIARTTLSDVLKYTQPLW
jgi:hypothetical protein